jgi:TPR repeat protein
MNTDQIRLDILSAIKNNTHIVIDKETISILEKQKDPDSKYLIGMIYEFGFGVEKNIKISDASYWEATKQGHSAAQLIMDNKHFEKEILGAKKTVTFSNDEEIPRYNMMSVKKQKMTL